jgi:hypothetical protein
VKLSLPITYNGWTASLTRNPSGVPSSGYLVESVEPSGINAVGYLDKRALADGVDAGDIFLSGREFGMIVTVFGSSEGDFWDKADDLLAAFSPTLAYEADTANLGFLPFDFYQPTADISTWPTSAYPSGIPLRYYLRPAMPPKYNILRDDVGGTAGLGVAKKFAIDMIARDPRKYLQTSQSLTISTTTQTATYRGNYPSWPIVTWQLSAAGSASFTLTINDLAVVIDLSGHSSGTFTLDYGTREFTKSGFGSVSSLITSGDFSQVQEGTTYRRANVDGMSGTTNQLQYREAWA